MIDDDAGRKRSGEPFLSRLVKLAYSAAGRRALWVAAIVGTLLNAINQGDALLSGASLHWGKLALTYAVPFCVSLHGAAGALRGSS